MPHICHGIDFASLGKLNSSSQETPSKLRAVEGSYGQDKDSASVARVGMGLWGVFGWRTGLEIDAWDSVGFRAEPDEGVAKSQVGHD